MKIENAIEGIEMLIKSIKEQDKKDDGDKGYLLGLDTGLIYLLKVQKDIIEPVLTHEQKYELKEEFKNKYIEKKAVSSYIRGMLYKSQENLKDISSEIEKKISEHDIMKTLI